MYSTQNAENLNMLKLLDDSYIDDDACIIQAIRERGFGHTEPDALDYKIFTDRGALHDAFERQQQLDPAPGNRWRSHGAVSIDCVSGTVTPMPARPYMQSLAYNQDDGGKERLFEKISDEVLSAATVGWIVRRNRRLASVLLDDIGSAQTLVSDVHFISYRPRRNEAAFSSPLWLHRDDERFVSVTLFSVSENLGGGESIMSPGGRAIDSIINMRRSMETIFLTHKGLHGVFPMYSKDNRPAFRNIIIATFK